MMKSRKKSIRKYDQPGICDFCGKYFRTLKHLCLHLTSHKEKNFECHHCSKRYRDKKHLRSHIQNKHISCSEPDAKYLCKLCDPPTRFFTLTALKVHEESHTPGKRYPCPECNRWFTKKKNMSTHVYRFHTDRQQQIHYCCKKCPYQTVVKSSFLNHQWVHVPEEQRQFRCCYCVRGFTNKQSRDKHESRVHLQIRPFVCQICGKSFADSNYLGTHIRLHTGEKPYECEICFERFGDRIVYRLHLINHELELGTKLDKTVKKFDKSFAPRNPNKSKAC